MGSIHQDVRELARAIGASPGGAAINDTLNNIARRLGGKPCGKGIGPAIDEITRVITNLPNSGSSGDGYIGNMFIVTVGEFSDFVGPAYIIDD